MKKNNIAYGAHVVYGVTVWQEFSTTRKRRGETSAGLLFIYFCTQRSSLFHLVVAPEVVCTVRYPCGTLGRTASTPAQDRVSSKEIRHAIPLVLLRSLRGLRASFLSRDHVWGCKNSNKKKYTVLPKNDLSIKNFTFKSALLLAKEPPLAREATETT